jgi:hypothetical protein
MPSLQALLCNEQYTHDPYSHSQQGKCSLRSYTPASITPSLHARPQQALRYHYGQQRRRCGHYASLRALRVIAGNAHHYGQSPVVAGIARHCGLRPANGSSSKKKRRTTTPTITDKAPSLRALRVIAGYDPQTTVAAKKNVGQLTPTITDNAPSLRALRVIAGYDPQTAAAAKKA